MSSSLQNVYRTWTQQYNAWIARRLKKKKWLQWCVLQLPSEQDAQGITVDIPRLDQYAATANAVKHCMHSRGLTEHHDCVPHQHKLILPPLKHNPNTASSVKLYCSWVGLFPQFFKKVSLIKNSESFFFPVPKMISTLSLSKMAKCHRP